MQVLTSIRDDLIKIGIGSYGLNAGNGIDLTAYQQAVELSKTNDVTIYTFGKTLPDIPNVDIRIVPEYRKPWKTQGLAKELKGYDFFISYGHPFFLLAPKLDNHVMVDFGTPALRYASSKKEAFFWSIIKAETAYAVRYSRLVLPGSKYIARSTQCWNANSFVNHSGIQFGNSAYPPIKLSSRGDPYVLYVGRHTPYKNVHTLIQIFRRVQKEVPNAHLVTIGHIEQDYIPQLQKAVGMTRGIHMLGYVDDIWQYYKGASAYANCSLWEGEDRPVLEAQSFGTPAVTYANCSHPEVIHHGHTALDNREFKNYLIDYLTDNQRNDSIVNFIRDEYSIETVASRLIKQLNKL